MHSLHVYYSLEALHKRFGHFGGCFMPELLMAPIEELTTLFQQSKKDPSFLKELSKLLHNYAGRPTPLTEVTRFAQAIKPVDPPRIFLKREDLLHTGAHKINNALGQCLLAKCMGKKRIIAETGAGQHGVATAAAAAHLGLQAVIYMGGLDMKRQMPNVMRMRLMGATVIEVPHGSATLKDAVNEALRDWSASFGDSYYCLGSALGPHPYPEMVATFQAVIGEESQQQCQERFSKNPDVVIACVGGGSNAIGIFAPFLNNPDVTLIGVEAGGHGKKLGEHAARFHHAKEGVLHGCYTYLLQNEHGQVAPTSSLSAGLDYPAVGPAHAQLFFDQRASYVMASDHEALEALQLLAKTEGIIPALESSHALAHLIKMAPTLHPDQNILVNLSGRGDKDLPELTEKRLL
ncbi:MAG: tryptophan synthase subunit beta [Chthoniobacterales bacterium]